MRKFADLEQNPVILLHTYSENTAAGYLFLNTVRFKHMFTFSAEDNLELNGILWEHVCVYAMLGEEDMLGWRDMEAVKRAFWRDDEEVHEIHPAMLAEGNIMSESRADKQRHLWRPKSGWGYR